MVGVKAVLAKHGCGVLAFIFMLLPSTSKPQENKGEPPKTIHVFVALADNQSQGIVPVPAKLGNGEDPNNNLYWGSAYGVKTFFTRSSDWQLLATRQGPKAEVLERCIFKYRSKNVYLVADAYHGNQIKQAVIDFLQAASGANPETITLKTSSQTLTFEGGGNANLVAYVGHDGLMDFQLSSLPQKRNGSWRETIILACYSKAFFGQSLYATGAYPLLWTNGLMAPEAYTLKSAIDGWILRESNQQIRERAAEAYHKYQSCSLSAARKLLTTGW
ncbi:MAG TPA: hypothetical protein VK738_21545 [Terriglobales bacterium]|nr:hypothetical protein [Terriglobales bacterium]